MANKYRTQYYKKSPLKNFLFIGLLLTMVGVTMYFANFLIQRSQIFEVGAAAGKADLFFQPNSLSLPPDGLVNVWATTDKQLSFASVEIVFNPELIKLTQEITLPNVALSEVIKKSTMAEANLSGKINFVIAVNPSTVSASPTGNFSLAGLKFASKTLVTNQSATLSFTTANIQLIDQGATPFSVTTQSLVISLNPTVSPTPTPVAGNTTGPVVVVKSPAQNYKIPSGGVWIGSEARDVDGIFLTNFYIDNTLIRTCPANQMVCNYTYKGAVAAGKHVISIEAIDNSPLKNKTRVNINVTK